MNLRLVRRRTGDLLLRRALGEIAEIEIARGAAVDGVGELGGDRPCLAPREFGRSAVEMERGSLLKRRSGKRR